MNTRSLRFQLVAWYAGLLTGCFVLIGAATYLVLQSSLVGALQDNQLRRAYQIGQLLLAEIPHQGEAGLGEQIETRFAPGFNDRFVRVARSDGRVLYRSGPPKDQNFDPAQLPPPVWPTPSEAARQVTLGAGRQMLLAGTRCKCPAAPGI